MASTPTTVSIVVVFFDRPDDARERLRVMERLSDEGGLYLVDAAVMLLDERSGRLEMSDSLHAAAGNNHGPHFLAAVFPPEVLGMGALGASATAAQFHFTELGIDVNLLKEIGENLPPGGAALVGLIEEKWLEDLSNALAGDLNMERFAIRSDASVRIIPKDIG